MRLLILALLLISCSSMPKPDTESPAIYVKGLQEEKQKQNQWCAAAAARMMMSLKTKNLPSQCDIVRKATGRDCFNNPITTESAMRAYGYSVQKVLPSFDLVVSEIKQNRPVTIYHLSAAGTAGQSGHAVVAYGTFNKESKDYILVYDPYYDRVMTWDVSYTKGNLEWYALVVFR